MRHSEVQLMNECKIHTCYCNACRDIYVIDITSHLYNRRVCHGADVPQILLIVGNLLEHPPHNLARPCLGQPWSTLDIVWGGEGSNLLSDHQLELSLHLATELAALIHGHKTVQSLSL